LRRRSDVGCDGTGYTNERLAMSGRPRDVMYVAPTARACAFFCYPRRDGRESVWHTDKASPPPADGDAFTGTDFHGGSEGVGVGHIPHPSILRERRRTTTSLQADRMQTHGHVWIVDGGYRLITSRLRRTSPTLKRASPSSRDDGGWDDTTIGGGCVETSGTVWNTRAEGGSHRLGRPEHRKTETVRLVSRDTVFSLKRGGFPVSSERCDRPPALLTAHAHTRG